LRQTSRAWFYSDGYLAAHALRIEDNPRSEKQQTAVPDRELSQLAALSFIPAAAD
jgi:hypothetical protein